MTLSADSAHVAALQPLEAELAAMLVSELGLEIRAQDLTPDTPLYGEGLGLDSIDILEVALLVSKKYGVQLKADNTDNFRIFGSLRSLAQYIAQHRAP